VARARRLVRQQVVADGGELGEGLGDHPGLALGDEHPDERGHPRVHLLHDRGSVHFQPPRAEDEELARVARGAAQRAGAGARVGQRGSVPRRGAAGGARGGWGLSWDRGRRGRRRDGARGDGEAQARRWRSLGVGLGRRRVCGAVVVVVVVVGRWERERVRAVDVVVQGQGEGEGDGGVHCAVLCWPAGGDDGRRGEAQPHGYSAKRVAAPGHATGRGSRRRHVRTGAGGRGWERRGGGGGHAHGAGELSWADWTGDGDVSDGRRRAPQRWAARMPWALFLASRETDRDQHHLFLLGGGTKRNPRG